MPSSHSAEQSPFGLPDGARVKRILDDDQPQSFFIEAAKFSLTLGRMTENDHSEHLPVLGIYTTGTYKRVQ